MEEFINKHTEKVLSYKKGIFKQKNAHDFVEKLTKKEISEIERELTKCLLNSSIKADNIIQDRKYYIEDFIKEIKELRIKSEQQNTENINNKNSNKVQQTENKNIHKTHWSETIKLKNYDKDFPSIEQEELIKRKKNFVVLDHHYKNKLEKGNIDCFCMSSKHPLVCNCLNCGRIHCLQEGDKFCINCGKKLLSKQEYLNNIIYDNQAKNANIHKDKLLTYQKEFYSKLKIIDDFTDWYEISTNTWLDDKSRNLAKIEDEKIKYEFTNDE